MCSDNRLDGNILFWSLRIDFKVSKDIILYRSRIRNYVQLMDIFVSLLFSGTISRNGTLIAPTCENTLIVPTSTTTTTTMAVCQLFILEVIEHTRQHSQKITTYIFLTKSYNRYFCSSSNCIKTLEVIVPF